MNSTILKDYCSSLLIRHYRESAVVSAGFSEPLLSDEDKSELLVRWSLSPSTERLARLVIQNPNLLNHSLNEAVIETAGELRGEIMARESVMLQMLTGDITRYSIIDSVPSFFNGPNHIVSWVLSEASHQIEKLFRTTKPTLIPDWIHAKRKNLRLALKNQLIRDVLATEFSKKRPSHNSKREAGRSRNLVYKQALSALHELELVEAFDESTILNLLNDTLLSPLEDWQLLELCTGLGVATSLGDVLNERVLIKLRIGSERVIAEVGPFLVIWQNSLTLRQDSQLDESELLAKEIATYIGSDLARSRVDISVVDKRSASSVAHFECKWFSNVSYARSAISDASLQIARYVRDSRPDSFVEARKLLRNSFIVVSELGQFTEKVENEGPVGFTDFHGIATGSLNDWASRLISA